MNVMETKIRKIDKNKIDEKIIEEAAEILREGGLVAFPTETVYGLGADALQEEAARKTSTLRITTISERSQLIFRRKQTCSRRIFGRGRSQ